MFGKIFKAGKKVQNNDLMQAIVGGMLLIGSASGELSKDERAKIDKLLTSNDNLSAFKPAEIRKVMQRFEAMLDADFLVGQHKIFKELADISDNPDQCEEVFLNMYAIANADGSIDELELTVLRKVARNLGINLQEYGLSA